MFNNFYAQMNEIVSSLRDNASSNAPVTQFFKDQRFEIAHALLILDNKQRSDILGITEELYTNRYAANVWRKKCLDALISLRDSGELTMNNFVRAHTVLGDIMDSMIKNPLPVVADVTGYARELVGYVQIYQIAGGVEDWRIWMLKSLLINHFYENHLSPHYTGEVWWTDMEYNGSHGCFQISPHTNYNNLYRWITDNCCDDIELYVLKSHPRYNAIDGVLRLKEFDPDLILIENLDDQNDLTQLINCYSGTKTVIGFSTQELLLSPGVNVVG